MQSVRMRLEHHHDGGPDRGGGQAVGPIEVEALPGEGGYAAFPRDLHHPDQDSAGQVEDNLIVHRAVPTPDGVPPCIRFIIPSADRGEEFVKAGGARGFKSRGKRSVLRKGKIPSLDAVFDERGRANEHVRPLPQPLLPQHPGDQ